LRERLLAGTSWKGLGQRERKKLLAATDQTIEMRRLAEAAARGEASMGLRKLAAEAAAAEGEDADEAGVSHGGVIASSAPLRGADLASRLASLSHRLSGRLKEADADDRRTARDRVRAKHRREKMLARGEIPSDDDGESLPPVAEDGSDDEFGEDAGDADGQVSTSVRVDAGSRRRGRAHLGGVRLGGAGDEDENGDDEEDEDGEDEEDGDRNEIKDRVEQSLEPAYVDSRDDGRT